MATERTTDDKGRRPGLDIITIRVGSIGGGGTITSSPKRVEFDSTLLFVSDGAPGGHLREELDMPLALEMGIVTEEQYAENIAFWEAIYHNMDAMAEEKARRASESEE